MGVTGGQAEAGPAGRPGHAVILRNVPLPEGHLLAIAAGFALQRARPWAPPGPRGLHFIAGGCFLAAGAWLVAGSLRAAARVQLDSPARLVVEGPYAFSRNPMYMGWALLHVGAGLAGRSGWVLAAAPAAAAWIRQEVRREEDALAGAFGAEFARYREAVPRYVPSRGRLFRFFSVRAPRRGRPRRSRAAPAPECPPPRRRPEGRG